MAVKTILQSTLSGGTKEDNLFLHTQVKQVEQITDDIQQIITDLRDTLWAYPFSVGLSAPQINQPYAISVINPTRESRDNDQIIINPNIISISGKKDRKRESCMSVWGKMGEVERRYKITLEYRDESFNLCQFTYTGFISRVIQHELDHLNGILYSEKLIENSTLQHADFFDEYSIIKG
ncbi:MAG: peptide deformylase [Ruminococcus flavefaciens]|nr:peptide deformylase [Ruminococcus flavefaciens]